MTTPCKMTQPYPRPHRSNRSIQQHPTPKATCIGESCTSTPQKVLTLRYLALPWASRTPTDLPGEKRSKAPVASACNSVDRWISWPSPITRRALEPAAIAVTRACPSWNVRPAGWSTSPIHSFSDCWWSGCAAKRRQGTLHCLRVSTNKPTAPHPSPEPFPPADLGSMGRSVVTETPRETGEGTWNWPIATTSPASSPLWSATSILRGCPTRVSTTAT